MEMRKNKHKMHFRYLNLIKTMFHAFIFTGCIYRLTLILNNLIFEYVSFTLPNLRISAIK